MSILNSPVGEKTKFPPQLLKKKPNSNFSDLDRLKVIFVHFVLHSAYKFHLNGFPDTGCFGEDFWVDFIVIIILLFSPVIRVTELPPPVTIRITS